MNRVPRTCLLLALAALCVAAQPHGTSVPLPNRVPADVTAVDLQTYIDANDLLMFLTNTGSFAYDKSGYFGRNDGCYYPATCQLSVLYASGIWLGAKVNGEVRVTAAAYTDDFGPGPMVDGTFLPDDPSFQVYKIARGDTRLSNPDYAEWPYQWGAPVVKNTAGGDSLDGEGFRIPLVLGKQALWAVFNDADPLLHIGQPSIGTAGPLGVEIQLYAYAYDSADALGRTVLLHYKIINDGTLNLDSMFLSIWGDPDVGDAANDLAGCDSTRSLGFCYNANYDTRYGDFPPAVGIDILLGPTVPAVGQSAWLPRRGGWVSGMRNLPGSAFAMYINGTDPRTCAASYNYMKGLDASGNVVINPATGEPTRFVVSGDPLTGSGWLDTSPADRRTMITAGPFTMAPSDTQEVVVAVVTGKGTDYTCIIPLFVDTLHAAHTAGTSTGSCYALVLDEPAMTGDDYRLSFSGSVPNVLWSLTDVTLGTTVIADQSNQTGDDNYPVVDGFMVKVRGSRAGIGAWSIPAGNNRWTSSNTAGDFKFEGFSGAMGWNSPCHYFEVCDSPGVSLPDIRRVKIQWAATDADGNVDPNDPDLSYGYRYGRNFSDPPAQPEFAPYIKNPGGGYSYQEFAKSLPLSAWDMDSDPPRRLAIGHLENNVEDGEVDGWYWPPYTTGISNTASTGPREWLWIFNTDYDTVPNPSFQADALSNPLPIMYFITACLSTRWTFAPDDEFLIEPVDPLAYNTIADTFEFSTVIPYAGASVVRTSAAPDPLLAVADLRRVDDIVQAFYDATLVGCSCPCHADPACDGVGPDILDVTTTINVAFRGQVSVTTPHCPYENTDVDCTQATDVIDVVKVIDVAFRGADPTSRFCVPCP